MEPWVGNAVRFDDARSLPHDGIRALSSADSEAVWLARAIVQVFAAEARCEGFLPVNLAVNNYSSGNQPHPTRCDTVQREAVPTLNSDRLIVPNVRANGLSDGHLTDADDECVQSLDRALHMLVAARFADRSCKA